MLAGRTMGPALIAALCAWSGAALRREAEGEDWAAKESSLQARLERMASLRPLSCAPTPAEVLREVPSPTSEHTATPNFYLFEEGPFDFRQVEACFANEMDALDDHVPPDHAAHLQELYLLRSLRKHPSRTMNIHRARVGVLAVPFFASYVAKCAGNGSTHAERMLGVSRGVREVHGDDRMKLLAINSWGAPAKVLGSELAAALRERGVTMAAADTAAYKEAMPGVPVVAIPYRAHYFADKLKATTTKRTVSVMLHGDLQHRHREGSHRWVLMDLAKLPNSSLESFSVHSMPQTEVNPQLSHTVSTMSKSKFCLVPAGDTATSRRFYDSLALGCVPVVLADFPAFAESLPFKRTVPWSQHALFLGRLDCLDVHMPQLFAYLRELSKLADAHPEVLEPAREGARAHFRSTVSVQSSGAVDALLHELA